MASVWNFIGSLLAMCIFAQLSTVHGKFYRNERNILWMQLSTAMIKEVAPFGEDGGPIVVNHTLEIQRILSLEDDILTLQVWEELNWKDSRLQWQSNLYGGVNELNIPSGSIWQPDIRLFNSVEDYKGFVSGDLNAVVTSDGNVEIFLPRITKSFCFINDSLLQEDKEISCTLKYGSWTHSLNTLDLRLLRQPAFINGTHRYWQFGSVTAERQERKYACCEEIYVDMKYILRLSRK